jgi:hypothetical protein
VSALPRQAVAQPDVDGEAADFGDGQQRIERRGHGAAGPVGGGACNGSQPSPRGQVRPSQRPPLLRSGHTV